MPQKSKPLCHKAKDRRPAQKRGRQTKRPREEEPLERGIASLYVNKVTIMMSLVHEKAGAVDSLRNQRVMLRINYSYTGDTLLLEAVVSQVIQSTASEHTVHPRELVEARRGGQT